MIKYFDFETEIEKIDQNISKLNDSPNTNSHKIEKLKNEKFILN